MEMSLPLRNEAASVIRAIHVLILLAMSVRRRSGRRESNPHGQLGRLGLCH
jgi:hypothetical protein